MINLYEVLKATAEQQPFHDAICDCEKGVEHTYADLLDQIDTRARQLIGAGIQLGDCVGLHLASGAEYIVTTYALWKIGACVVPIPLELALPEKRQVCQRIAINVVISSGKPLSFLNGIEVKEVSRIGVCSVVHIVPAREHPAGFAQVNAAFIRFSSGTTGAAKGVVLSHETIFDRIHVANDGLQLSPRDRVVWLLSMSYHFAVSIVAYLSFGATIILHKRAVDLGRAVVEDATEQGGTIIYGGPMQYDLMSRDRSRKMMDNLRLAISTATSLSVDTAQAFWDRFGVPLTQAFGVIEIGLPCINLHYAMEKMDSVGHVLPGFDIRLIEQDESIGQSSISFRGKGILDAYYDPWQDRSDILDDGWFCTGDLGELDEDDCLYIRGRATEMINVGGMKFFPHEVETVLASHPAIEEAVVYPSRQGNSREFTCAQVVSKSDITNLPTSAELRQYCAKRLAHFKVPQEVEYVSSLERTASGKILRRVVVRDY